MNKFFKNFNHYSEGALWLDEVKVRLAKKRGPGMIVEPQEYTVERRGNTLPVEHIVFRPTTTLKIGGLFMPLRLMF